MKEKNPRLNDNKIKFIAYLFAYTHYCIGNGYDINTDYSAGFGYNRNNNIGYTIPLDYIYKVDVPFANIKEFLIQISFFIIEDTIYNDKISAYTYVWSAINKSNRYTNRNRVSYSA